MARVMLFNGLDWDPIDWEVPVTSGTITQRLSHSLMLNVQIPAEYNREKFNGSKRILEYGAHLAIETNGGNLHAGVPTGAPIGDQLNVTAHGYSVFSKDQPWPDAKPGRWTTEDALVVWRQVWAKVLGLSRVPHIEIIGDATSGATIGKSAHPKWLELTRLIESAEKFVSKRENRVDYWDSRLQSQALKMFRASGRKSAGEVVTMSDPPEAADAATHKAVIEEDDDKKVVAVHFWEWTGVGAGHWVTRGSSPVIEAARYWRTVKASRDRAKDLYPTYVTRAKEAREERDEKYPDGAPEPFEVNRWADRDLSKVLADIREVGGFDWVDSARWDGDQVVPQIQVANRAGARRDDLHLELGVNILGAPDLVTGSLATHVTALGQGEGAATLMVDRILDHPRLLRKHLTVEDKDLRTLKQVDALADKALNGARRALRPQIQGLKVTDHPLAPLSEIRLGDVLPVVGTLRDGSDLDEWVRVTEITQDLAGNTIEVKVENE